MKSKLQTHGARVGLGLALLCAWQLAPESRAVETKPELAFQLPLSPAGLTVTQDGSFLISVSFEDKPQNRVIKVGKSGESKPFPTTPLSQAAAGEALVLDAVEGMQATDGGLVWMLDNGRRTELPPKVIVWDGKHERLHRVFNLAAPAVLATSLLQDLAVDPEQPCVYLADPASGPDAALVVLDTVTGLARRVLQGHPSVVPVTGLELAIDGQKLETRRLDGTVVDPKGGVNPIALDRKGEWLYYGPLRSLKLYRVRTEHLRDAKLGPDTLAGLVEEYSPKPMCDGITLDGKGNVYVSDLARKAIGMITAGDRAYRVLATDPRFLWPDGLCFDAAGRLCFFTNTRKATPPALLSSPAAAAALGTNYLFRLQTPASGRVGD